MEYGIQRRGIYLAPPTEAEVEWFCDQFESREVWEMFGLEGPSKLSLLRLYRGGDLVVGILHRVEPRKRIGFVVMFPPDPSRDFWEFGYAIADPLDRDAFSAMSSTDAMAHYMFEHLHVEAMGWRTRSDNHAASAVIRRLGYTPRETRDDKNYKYTIYRLDREGWFRRRAKLDRGEATHPSGIGDTFVTLPTFPYEPIPVPRGATDAPVDASTTESPGVAAERGSAPPETTKATPTEARRARSAEARAAQPTAAKATKAKATNAKATTAKATQAKATTAKATQAKATPAKASQAKATKTDAAKPKATQAKATKTNAAKPKATRAKATKRPAAKKATRGRAR